MQDSLKNFIKKLIPFPITKNQKYDKQTALVINKVCRKSSNCIDVGAHKGEVFRDMIRAAPDGIHFAFEPIPHLYEKLRLKYADRKNCTISDIALSNKKGHASFNYVVSNPSYSGLIKRQYDRENERDEQITVRTDRLDDIYPASLDAGLIKIDVEGGELLVLEGAQNLLKRCRPVVIFEHGLGASDFYGSTPEQVFELLTHCGLKISTMKRWLSQNREFTKEDFDEHYYAKKDYYFIAYP